MPDSETIKLVAALTSTVVAVFALIIGFRNEARNQKRFDSQLEQGKKIAEAAARPLVFVELEGYEDEKAVTLQNRGPGTAIITSVSFSRGHRKATDISHLVDVPDEPEIVWNEITPYDSPPYYMASKSTEDIIRISAERLLECGVGEKKSIQLLDSIEKQLEDIKIVVEYEDVFGQKFEAIG